MQAILRGPWDELLVGPACANQRLTQERMRLGVALGERGQDAAQGGALGEIDDAIAMHQMRAITLHDHTWGALTRQALKHPLGDPRVLGLGRELIELCQLDAPTCVLKERLAHAAQAR